MGLLDKAKAQAQQLAQKAQEGAKGAQEKMETVQAKKKADGMLRDLGAWYYATQTGRDEGRGEAEMARIITELQNHEAEHGPLGGAGEAAVDEAPGAPGAPAAPEGGFTLDDV
jgi:hypothetical protein